MAEGFLFNMIEKLIVKLGDVVVEAWNVRDDVKKLVKNMREIYAVIYDAEEQQQVTNNHQVKLWLDDLKDTLYDVEDLLDDVSTEHLRRQVMTRDKKAKKVRIFFSSSNPLVSSFNMAPKIKELRKSIEELNINGKSFNFTNRRPAEPRVRQLRENTHSYVLEDQVIGRDIYGDILVFKMHDIVHDLACFIAKNDDYVMVNEKVKRIDKQTRHLSVESLLDSSGQVSSFLLQANKLRTFLLYREEEMKESDYNQMISNFKKVRVLKFRNRASTTIPSCIGMLKHLRYLDLSNNNQIEVLPSSITELINLETLLLNRCTKLRELPKDLWKLTSLRHLELKDCDEITCMPCGMGRLAKLQTLTQFVLGPTSKHNAGASELRELNNLRGKLKIKGLKHLRLRPTEAKEMNLIGKSHLQSLELSWGNDIDGDTNDMEKDDIILQHLLMQPNIKALTIDGFEGVGVAFSRSDNTFKNLKEFSLSCCKRLQYLPQLEVESIQLEYLPRLEWIVNDNSNGNSSALSPLEITLWNLQNLKGWCRCSEEEMQRGCCHHQFKSVDYMEITNCPNMISIPQCTGSK